MPDLDISPNIGKAKARRMYKVHKGLGFKNHKWECPVCGHSICRCADVANRSNVQREQNRKVSA